MNGTTLIKNQTGQMTIFIALIFQVLFVFFAMIVNVGLIVHDKINLQNSVDIAAYYGAQRQAELLNAIAHQNYQIRQAWKLLAWRLRVLGDLGYEFHPLQQDSALGGDTASFLQSGNGRYPRVCINNPFWGRNQSLCYDDNIRIPQLPVTPVRAPIGPVGFLNVLTNRLTQNLQTVARDDCKGTGPNNFDMALRWVAAYRAQVARAKETIRIYADELSKNTSDFTDVKGGSASGGSLTTLVNNLTRTNRRGMGEESFKFYNSLGQGDRKAWLHDVPLFPKILYTDFSGTDGNCIANVKSIEGINSVGLPQERLVPSREYDFVRNEPNQPDDLYHSTFGVEKNPWMMAYVAVYAESKPRKPYLPFGEPITLRARAYAKPFGGRIGPWFFSKWPEGSNKSVGNSADKLDPMLPIPLEEGASFSLAEVGKAIPNYSRYPGDELGLLSNAALNQFRNAIRPAGQRKILKLEYYSGVPTGDDGLAMALNNSFFQANNDTQLQLGYRGPWIRDVEAAAIAPDLFDATYYSIDPVAYENYTKPSVDGGLIPQEKIPLDFGSYGDEIRSVENQVEIVNNLKSPSVQSNFYIIDSIQHLLTGWAPSGAYQYDFPESSYGKCFKEGKIPVPGKCAQGGRVGYSVKIISEDYLKSTDLPLGGEGIKGPIKNPPPF